MRKGLPVLLALVVSVGAFVRTPVSALALSPASPQRSGEVLVFAAASLQTVLDALVEPARQSTGVRMRISYAASSALARQIENGAPAGLFISADLDWMDYLVERKLVQTASRVNLAGNRLVLIAPRSEPVSLRIAPGFPLAATLGANRLALANPDAVPAGKYAKAALTACACGTAWPAKWPRQRTCVPHCSWSLVARRVSASCTRRTPRWSRACGGGHVLRHAPSTHRVSGGAATQRHRRSGQDSRVPEI